MCGRFAQAASPAALVQELGLASEPALHPRYNVAPSQPVAIVVSGPRLETAAWGFPTGEGSKRLLLARAETVEHRPAFRAAFQGGRCLVPVTGFFEWRGEGRSRRPWLVRRQDGGIFTLGAIRETKSHTVALVTTDANSLVAPIHDRMPLVVAAADRALWLDPAAPVAELERLLHPAPEQGFEAYPVSRRVNDPAHDEPSVIEREPDKQGELF